MKFSFNTRAKHVSKIIQNSQESCPICSQKEYQYTSAPDKKWEQSQVVRLCICELQVEQNSLCSLDWSLSLNQKPYLRKYNFSYQKQLQQKEREVNLSKLVYSMTVKTSTKSQVIKLKEQDVDVKKATKVSPNLRHSFSSSKQK